MTSTSTRGTASRGGWLAAVLTIALVAATVTTAAASSGITVDPAAIELELAEGDTVSETVTVSIPEGSTVARADVYLLMDTTGSMGSSINAMKSNAQNLMDQLVADFPDLDLAFGAGDFKDFQSPNQGDPYAFRHSASITTDTSVVSAAIDGWSASGGGDLPEGHFYAYDQIAENRAPSNDGSPAGTIGWRSGAKRILVTFADVGGHDLVCKEITGQVPGHEVDYDITEATVTTKFQATGITFIGISVPTGPGMDASSGGSNYNAACGTSGASAGQASRLAAATGGAFIDSVSSDVIVETVRDQITTAVSTINSLTLVPTGDTAAFVAGVDPSSHGPLDGGVSHEVSYAVDFEGVEPSSTDEQTFTGTFEARADGSVVGEVAVTITVPPIEVLAEEDEEDQEDQEPVEVLDEAEAADPVAAEPTFTG